MSKWSVWQRTQWALQFETSFPLRVNRRRIKKWEKRDVRESERTVKRLNGDVRYLRHLARWHAVEF